MSQNLRQIFAMPIVVGVISTAGLIAALVGDGLWDALSWGGLGLAVVLCARYGLPWRRRRP